MAQGQDFLASLASSTDLQAVITAMQNLVVAVNLLSTNLTAALVNVANQNG